jgi:hypothetical protein
MEIDWFRWYLKVYGTTVRSLIKLNATVTSRLLTGTAWLTVKRYKAFQIRVKYRSIKMIKSTHLAVPAGSRVVTVAFNFISERTCYKSLTREVIKLSFVISYVLNYKNIQC